MEDQGLQWGGARPAQDVIVGTYRCGGVKPLYKTQRSLGIEAQHEAVARFLNGGDWQLSWASFVRLMTSGNPHRNKQC
jgi:hypothetical protein